MAIITITHERTKDFNDFILEIKPKIIFYFKSKNEGYTCYYVPYEGHLVFCFSKFSLKEICKHLSTDVKFIEAECKEIVEEDKKH